MLLPLLFAAARVPAIVFVHVNVIPMDREVVLRDQTVVVRGHTIVSVANSASSRLPEAATVINGRNKFLTPGLFDSHVHLLSSTEFPLYIANGVTGVLNLEGRPAHLGWRRKVNEGALLGPRIFTSGPIFNRRRTAAEAVAEVDRQADAGYDAIKIYNQVSRDEYAALADEAHKRNMLFVGHIARQPGFKLTLEKGQSIAHAEEILYTFFNPKEDGNNDHIVFDESRIPLAAAEIANAGVSVIGTAITYHDILLQRTELPKFLKRPDLKYLAPWTRARLDPAANIYLNGFTDAQVPRIRTSLRFIHKLIKALHDAGVNVMSGTDATDIGPVAGFSLSEELQKMVDSGLTPFEALQTATTAPAIYLHRENEFGKIVPGMRADLLLLDSNPLQHIDNVRAIAGVLVNGTWHPKRELQQMLANLPLQYLAQRDHITAMLRTNPEKVDEYSATEDPFGRIAQSAPQRLLESDGTARFRRVVSHLHNLNARSPFASEVNINVLGYALIREKKLRLATDVMITNTQLYPKSGNVYDSLADSYIAAGNIKQAVASYRKALAIAPNYANAKAAREYISAHG